jgi:hypothetical protein
MTAKKWKSNRKTIICSTGVVLILLAVIALTLSSIYLSLFGTADEESSTMFADQSSALIVRLHSQFNQSLYSVNVIAIAMSVVAQVDNDTFTRFVDGLYRQDVALGSTISFPTSIVWAKFVPLSDLGEHIQQVRSEVGSLLVH